MSHLPVSCQFGASLQVMRRMLQLAGTRDEPRARWNFDMSDEFLAWRRGSENGTLGLLLVALVTSGELNSNQLRQYPCRTTVLKFIERCTKVAHGPVPHHGVLGR